MGPRSHFPSLDPQGPLPFSPMKSLALCAAWLGLLAPCLHAAPVAIANPSFETQTPELLPNQSTLDLAPWLESGGPVAPAGSIVRLDNFAAEGTDHLAMLPGHDVWQDIGLNFQSNTLYTLTVASGNRPGATVPGNASTAALTTSSGAIFATASADAFVAAPVGTFADAPILTLDTVEEPGAVARPIRLLLRARGNGPSHFDNLRLDASPIDANGRPIGTSIAATLINASGATVGGSVTSIGSTAPTVTIYYGPADAGSDPANWPSRKILPGTISGAFTAALTDLPPSTRHYYRARFTNPSGSTWASATRFFDTLFLPAVTNLPATNFAPESATVGARVSTYSGLPPAVTIYYGLTDGGTTLANWSQSVSLGQVLASASGSLTNLQPSTTYRYRAYAANAAGGAWAPETLSFTTPAISPPSIENHPATQLSLTSAQLQAEVTHTGNQTPTVTFYGGPVDGGTDPSAWALTLPVGLAAGHVKTLASGLTPNTLYYFRAAATNRAGTTWAPTTASFTTSLITPPQVATLPPSHVRSSLATLNAQITATGQATPSAILYWGPTDGGTLPAAWQFSRSLGPSSDTFSTVLSGLTPNSQYFFRAFAANSSGGSWAPTSATFTTLATEAPPAVVINEIHYDPLDPTKFQEFIELYNPGDSPVDLTGWRLSDAVDYTFGPISLPPGGYFCATQNPAKFAATWPTAAPRSVGPWLGKLSNGGETIQLRDAANNLICAVDYAAGFPWPSAPRGAGPSLELLHPALDPALGASWRRSPINPTPGAVNAARLASAASAPPAIRSVHHSPQQPTSATAVPITATVTDPDGVASVALRYQIVSPGTYIRKTDAAFSAAANWITLPMLDDGTSGDAIAGDAIFTALIPPSVQVHRRLIRYQITVTDTLTNSVRVPYADDEQPNFAYFVYDALPPWSGALRPTTFSGFPATPVQDFPRSLLQSIEPWHLIANEANVMSCQFDSGSNGVLFQGTLVHRGQVYDHITYQVRGIGSTYVSGKNKWGLKFNRTHDFQAYDNWGRPYAQTWNSLGLNACASPWASVNRGAAGIEEAVSNRIYELGGVPALRTNYVHWRVIRRTAEVNPATATVSGDPLGASLKGQYSGDLWGLYLALEPTEGNFLDERNLPDGNLYAIEGDGGDKKHQGETQPLGTTDWDTFRNANAQANQTEAWYRANQDLNALYTFLAFSRLIGNVDVRPGDNYRYYHRPTDNRWVVIPYDLDMMFIAAHHWGGAMDSGITVAASPNTIRAISRHPAIALEYRNRCRELLSLMASDASPNGGQIGQLIQEYARLVNPPDTALTWSDLDAAMWNLHPRSAGSGANSGQSNHRGNFFRTRYLDGGRGGLGGTGATSSWIRDLEPTGSFSDHEHMAQWFIDFSTNTYPATAAAWIRKATNAGGSGADSDVNRQKGYGFKYLQWESLYGGFVDANAAPAATSADTAYPHTPVLFASGLPTFPANDLRFTSSDFNDPQGSSTAAAVQWRLGEISAPGLPNYDASKPFIYELENLWTSDPLPLTSPSIPEVKIPAAAVESGHTYRARVRHRDATGRWSYWSAPVQFIAGSADPAPFQAALRITTLNYDPAPPTPTELAHPSWDPLWTAAQFEFIELSNISKLPVDLSDVRFTKGVDYDFPPGTTLDAGAKIIVAKNPLAFAIRYGTNLPLAPGGYGSDSLANGGEQLKLSLGSGLAIIDFSYNNKTPWPTAPNGTGPSLVLISPAKPNLNHGDPYEWRASYSAPTAAPGLDTPLTFAAWSAQFPAIGAPNDDPDRDGLSNLLEFALASSPTTPSPQSLPSASQVGDAFRFSLTYAPYHTGATRHIEFTDPSGAWQENGVLVDRTTLPDGRFRDTYQSPRPIAPANPRQFARLRVTLP